LVLTQKFYLAESTQSAGIATDAWLQTVMSKPIRHPSNRMKKIAFIIILVFVFSCKKEEKRNDRLIYYQSTFIAEMGDEVFERLYPKLDSKIRAQYLNDIIYVSKIIEENACGQYEGDIEVKNDSIYLIQKLKSDEVCTSTALTRVTYIIKNPKQKRYKFLFK